MTDRSFNKMDPVYETMGLILISNAYDRIKQETIESLTELGFDGENFYSQNFRTYDKYVEAFTKYKTKCEDEDYFFDSNNMFYYLLMSLMIENKEWFNSVEQLTDSEIRKQMVKAFDFTSTEVKLEDLESMIQYLEQSGLEPDSKWKMLKIFQRPVHYITQLINIIKSNMDAYYKAVHDVIVPLEKMLSHFDSINANNGDKKFYEFKTSISKSSIVYPSLAFPASQIIFEKNCYYGLITERITKDGEMQQNAKNMLLRELKALSDSSKLAIITSLKTSPKYNLEIAQQLGLTAATMSHHMSVLLNCGLVGVEKKDGKVYYHLNNNNLQSMIDELRKTLL